MLQDRLNRLVESAKKDGYARWESIEELVDSIDRCPIEEVLSALATAGLEVHDDALPEVSDSSDDPVNIYSREMSVPPLSREREAELGRLMRGKTRAAELAKRDLVEANLSTPVAVARQFASERIHVLDLIQEGNIALMDAADRFNPDGGYRFEVYARWSVRQRIKRVAEA